MTIYRASLSKIVGLLLSAYRHPAWILAALGMAAGIAVLAFRTSLRKHLVFCTLSAVVAGSYFLVYDAFHASELKGYGQEEISIWVRGSIDSAVQRDGDVARLYVEASDWSHDMKQWVSLRHSERIAVRVRLSKEQQAVQTDTWKRGSTITANLQLSLPASARNPHAFDYAQYLRWQGVHVTGEASYSEIKVGGERGIWGYFQQWQKDAAERVERLFEDPEVAGYMKSLLLGVGDEVDLETANMYADLGLSHVLAISGLHVTLVSSMFMWCLERVGMRRRSALVTTACLLVGYVLLVGASASAVRSGLMGGVGLPRRDPLE